MTANELIEALKKFPPECRVMVNGYEGGLDDPTLTGPVEVFLDVHDSDVYGPHDLNGPERNTPATSTIAVILEREGR